MKKKKTRRKHINRGKIMNPVLNKLPYFNNKKLIETKTWINT